MTPIPTSAPPTARAGELATWLAHELRNPLAPIAAAAELLVRQPPAEQVRQLAIVIERNAARLRARIDELVRASHDGALPWPSGFALEEAAAQRLADPQLSLALEEGQASGARGGQVPQQIPEMASLRILVVDDNCDAGRLLGLFVRSLGHEVLVATDPLEALERAGSFEPQLALLDIGLPGMDGYDLARALRRLPGASQLRLAAVTAYNHSRDRQAATRAGFERYFVKPLDVDALQTWLALVSLQGDAARRTVPSF
jgi:CheY-like chemotaxis protein